MRKLKEEADKEIEGRPKISENTNKILGNRE